MVFDEGIYTQVKTKNGQTKEEEKRAKLLTEFRARGAMQLETKAKNRKISVARRKSATYSCGQLQIGTCHVAAFSGFEDIYIHTCKIQIYYFD